MLNESSSKKNSPKKDLSVIFTPTSSHLLKATIKIPSNITSNLYKQTIRAYQEASVLAGFKQKQTPIEYIEENYREEIEQHIKNLLFKHIVLDHLINQVIEKKIPLTNYPRLHSIKKESNKEFHFTFNLSVAEPLRLKEWKNFIFRAPKRKKYKDLDKQVASFLKNEVSLYKKQEQNFVQENDWVYLNATIVNKKKKPINHIPAQNYWIKVNNKFLSKPFQSLLLDKKIDDTFITKSFPIKNDFLDDTSTDKYCFLIKINDIAKGNYFSLDHFKSNFKLKSKQEVHSKLIEIFSYRNDISQRKAIIEELFHLLLSKHRFEIPKHFTIRRQEDILMSLRKHPDYQVYKQEDDFLEQIAVLAEKQLKEEILIDQIAYTEDVQITEQDIQNYLCLFNNSRLKEFIYFKPLLEKIDDSDAPLQTGLLKQAVLREKTLNYVIHTLTK